MLLREMMTLNVGLGVKNTGEEPCGTELSTHPGSQPSMYVFPSEDPVVAGIQKLRLDHEAAEPEWPAFPLQEFVLCGELAWPWHIQPHIWRLMCRGSSARFSGPESGW